MGKGRYKAKYVIQSEKWIHEKNDIVSTAELRNKFDVKTSEMMVLNRHLQGLKCSGEILFLGFGGEGRYKNSYWLSAKAINGLDPKGIEAFMGGSIRKALIERGEKELLNLNECLKFGTEIYQRGTL